MSELKRLRKVCVQRRDQFAVYLTSNGCSDFQDYRHITGRLGELDELIEEIDHILKTVEDDEDGI